MSTVDNNLVDTILRSNLKPINEALHGWIILIDGKVWKSSMGNFLFSTRKQATSSFYNNMRWKVTNAFGASEGADRYWRNASIYWDRFKKALENRIEIKEI